VLLVDSPSHAGYGSIVKNITHLHGYVMLSKKLYRTERQVNPLQKDGMIVSSTSYFI